MKILIFAAVGLLVSNAAMGQQPGVCDLLKTALAGNSAINGNSMKDAPSNMAWPVGSTRVGKGSYFVTLFSGMPPADNAKMERAIADAEQQVARCFPTAKRLVATVGAIDREIRYCVAGSARSVLIESNRGSTLVSAYLSVETPKTRACP